MINIKIDRSRSSRTIIICDGKLDGTNAEIFENTIRPVIEEANLPIVLDLARINHITDLGLQALQNLFDRSKEIWEKHSINQTEKLRISKMSSEVRDLLRMRGLLLSMTHSYSNYDGARYDHHYQDILKQVRDVFPSPISDFSKDSFFIQSVNKSLAAIKQLKTSIPFLGDRSSINYESARNSYLSESFSTLDETVYALRDYMQGMLNWGHPKVQKNVHPPATTVSIIGQMFGSILQMQI